MKYSENSFTIDSNNLKCDKNYYSTLIITKPKTSIIKGEILDSQGTPMSNVVVEVDQINLSNNQKTILGYTTTNSLGKYAFSLTVNTNMAYEFLAYSTIS